MTGWNGSLSRGSRAMEALLWVCAGLVMLSVHVGAAVWLMREQPVMAADDAPPAAIMIELAPEPEAVFTEANEVALDLETAELSVPVEEVLTLEETPPTEVTEQIEPEPVEEVAEAESESLEEVAVLEPEELQPVEEQIVMLPDVEVPVPAWRPRPPEPEKEVVEKAQKKPEPKKPAAKKPVKQRQQAQAASKSAQQAKAQVRKSNRNAARQSASGVSSMSPARWQSRLMAHLERRKRYPSGARSRREQGTVYVRFRIDDGGNVLSVSLAGSSGFPELDDEVLSLVRRASPVPTPPPGVNKTITAPVRFSLR